jgi:Ferritin-like
VKIRSNIVREIQAGGVAELHKYLQSAIELEHATIPVYQAALYSIKPGTNRESAAIIASVAREEMLHLNIAANVLNALGGAPVIDKPGFIPVFPGPLPMGIGDLRVSLQKLTRGHVYDTFMAIEQPETALNLPVQEPRLGPLAALGTRPPVVPVVLAASASAATETATVPTAEPEYATIGDFYEAIIGKLKELGEPAFTRPSHPQVVDNTWFPASQLFPIEGVESAIAALTVIIDQGEGTKLSPLESPHGGPVAHYYRFAEIVYARRLVRDEAHPNQFSYSGAPVPLDPAGVWNLLADAKSVDYAEGTQARRISDRFNYSYTSLLKALHETFNGRPDNLSNAFALMYELKLLGGDLAATRIDGTDYQAAPTFEYATRPL